MENKSIANDVLELKELWESTDKSVIADNIEKYLFEIFPESVVTLKSRLEKLAEISGSQEQTVYAWINRSRENVKVPLLKLCIIAQTLDIDVLRFFE